MSRKHRQAKAATAVTAFAAIGSAIAGEALTPDALMRRLRDADFRKRFNGPAPPVVVFPDEATAKWAADFENMKR